MTAGRRPAGELPLERAHHVACETCRRDVPRADALSAEGKEYVAYFCGAPCYESWRGREARPSARR